MPIRARIVKTKAPWLLVLRSPPKHKMCDVQACAFSTKEAEQSYLTGAQKRTGGCQAADACLNDKVWAQFGIGGETLTVPFTFDVAPQTVATAPDNAQKIMLSLPLDYRAQAATV